MPPVSTGAVVGAVVEKCAGDLVETPVSPKDILTTAFYLMGIDPHSTVSNPEGQLIPICGTGQFRPELLG